MVVVDDDRFRRALHAFRCHELETAESEAVGLLEKEPLDQAAWLLRVACAVETAYVDELENDDISLAEQLEERRVATGARPGTSFSRPVTNRQGTANPINRPPSALGRPQSGVVRLGSSAAATSVGTSLGGRLRTARTALASGAGSNRLSTAVSATRHRLATASLAAATGPAGGPVVNLARLNVPKYAANPQTARLLFDYAFFVDGNVPVALQIAKTASETAHDKDPYWRNQIGVCLVRLSQLDAAESHFMASLELHRIAETYAHLSRVYCRLDQPLKAIQVLEAGLNEHRRDVLLLTHLARVFEGVGRTEEASEKWKDVVREEATHREALACLGAAQFQDEQAEIGVRYYRRLVQLAGDGAALDAALLLNCALCCWHCDQWDLALGCLAAARPLAGDDVLAHLLYDSALFSLSAGDVRTAERSLRLALDADPDHAESLCCLGVLRMRRGATLQARSLFSAAVRKAPHLFEPHFNLALLLHQMGRYTDAFESVNAALLVFPSHTQARRLLAHIKSLFSIF